MSHDNAKRRQSTTTRLSHDQVHDLLHAYAHEILIGGSPEAIYPEVAHHLANCAQCHADLAEMLEVTRSVCDSVDVPVLAIPSPDLSRLPRPWQNQMTAGRPWFIDRFERLWLEFSQPLLQAWQPSLLQGSARGTLLFAYRQETASSDPSVRLEVYAEDDPAMTQISVNIDVPSRNPLDQSGLLVTVYVGDTTRQTRTDTSGTAHFQHIPRDSLVGLRLAVTLGQST